jgi:hypothetical protein
MTSADYFFPFFLLFVASGLFLWLLGAAAFYRSLGMESIFRAPWLGLAILVGLLQLGHLFFPINNRFSASLLAVTAVVAVFALLFSGFRAGWTRRSYALAGASLALLAAISLLAFVPAFNCCTKEMFHYDLGLYYLKTIRWMESFPIVRGLVNVQPHLGFNQSAFLITSFFDSMVPERRGLSLIGGILPWLGLSLSLFAMVRLGLLCFLRNDSARPIEVAYAISLPAWIFALVGGNVTSASPDCISSCLMIHLFLIFACFVVSSHEEEWKQNFGEILAVGALCLCIKLNSLGLVAGIWTIATILFYKRAWPAGVLRRRVLLMAGLPTFLLGTWMWRGVTLSGYPFFPSTALAMPVEWRMPRKEVWQFYGLTVWCARDPDFEGSMKRALKTWKWLPHWRKRILHATTQFAWPLQVGIMGSAAMALTAAVAGGILRKNAFHFALLAVPVFLNAALWFFTAPDPRYFGPSVWLFAICPALTFVAGSARLGTLVSAATLCASAVPLFFLAWDFAWNWSYPEPRLPTFRTVEMEWASSNHGVTVWFPAKGDQTFDGPIPSSKSPRPDLAYIDPQKGIGAGFKYLKGQNPSQP